MFKFATLEGAVAVLEAGTPQEAVEAFHGLHYYNGSAAEALELVRQDRLNEIWRLSREARAVLVSRAGCSEPGAEKWLARISDEGLKIALAASTDLIHGYGMVAVGDFVHDRVIWHIVGAGRSVLYPDLLERSGMFRFTLLSQTVHPTLDQIDPRLSRALAQQAFDKVKAGDEGQEEEVNFLLYDYAPSSALPFNFLESDQQAWLAGKFPASVALVLGYQPGMEVSSAKEVLDIFSQAGLEKMAYEIRGEAESAKVMAFNRRVCEAAVEVPADALLIKEGFGWEVEATEIRPAYTTGGSCFVGDHTGETEYDVTVVTGTRVWTYRSRSGRSVIKFRREEATWQFEGKVSLNCLHDLKQVGIEPTILFGTVKVQSFTVIEAAKAVI